MKNLKEREVILSIETTTGGGSLSILADSLEIDGWTGHKGVSKADKILEQISNLLSLNKIEKKNVKLICVASGTGSSTGEKIGWAIGKGLAKAFRCRLQCISILESLLLEIENEPDGDYITAVPCGKNFICRQRFAKTGEGFFPISPVRVCGADEFFTSAKSSLGCKKIVIATIAADHFRQLVKNADDTKLVEYKYTLANLIGRIADSNKRV